MIKTIYDNTQHCIATKEPQHKFVAMDCPYSGKGEEFSPTNMVEAALGGCILLSMGTLAMRDKLDISDTVVEVHITTTDGPVIRFKSVEIMISMSHNFSDTDRLKLKRAAESCPIKHSLDPNIPVHMVFNYPAVII